MTTSLPAPPAPLEAPHQRLRFAREQAGFARASDAARAMGVEEPTYLGHENGSRGLSRAGPRYAKFFRVSLDWLLAGRGEFRLGGGDSQGGATSNAGSGRFLADGADTRFVTAFHPSAPPRNAEVG